MSVNCSELPESSGGVVAEPADGRPCVAPVVGVAPRGRAPGAALLPARHALPHAVHRLEQAAPHLPEVAEAAHQIVGGTTRLHVEGGGGGGGNERAARAEPVLVGEQAFPRLRGIAGRPKQAGAQHYSTGNIGIFF